MKLISWIIFGLSLVLITPSALAYHGGFFSDPDEREERDLRQRVLASNTQSLDGAAVGNLLTHTFPWNPEYTYDDIGHVIRARFDYTMIVASTSDGVWTITTASEKGPLTNCTVSVETINPIGISLDAMPIYAHYSWACLFTQSANVHPHNHTVYINRTATSGNPANPTHESISVLIETEDIVVVNNGINEIVEFTQLYLPTLLFFFLILVAEWKKDLIYHLLTVVLGIIVVGSDIMPTIRLVIVALIIYQIFRAYNVGASNRNKLGVNEHEN